jgi:predicted extracellular nuclease
VAIYSARSVQAVGSNTIVISQIYGGGGNTGAQYQNDFVELFNRGTSTVSVNGWSVGYASATGTGNFAGTNKWINCAGSVLSSQIGSYSAAGAPLPALCQWFHKH